jgi:hypothetical protein
LTNAAPNPPVVTFHAEPAGISRVDEYGRLEESADLSASYTCAMRHVPEHEGALGWRERENVETSHIGMEWQPFYAVQLPGETEPQRFCEDDARWITLAAEYLLAEDSA